MTSPAASSRPAAAETIPTQAQGQSVEESAKKLFEKLFGTPDWSHAHARSTIADALRAERERGARERWMPIETAPKDRTRIILATIGGHVTVGHWLDNSNTSWPWQGWSTDRGPFAIDGVTHWMPLPSPPAQDGGSETQTQE